VVTAMPERYGVMVLLASWCGAKALSALAAHPSP
jgi:hypothetical protein